LHSPDALNKRERFLHLTRIICCGLILSCIVLTPSSAFSWPLDYEWTTVLSDGLPIVDAGTDDNGSRNIVGTTEYPAAFIYNDGTYLYFRLRLDSDPSAPQPTPGDELDSFGWGVEINIDSELGTYEWLVMVEGIGDEYVELQQNTYTDPNNYNDFGELSEVTVSSYPVVLGSNVRIIYTTPNVGKKGPGDYFIDWKIPLSDLTSSAPGFPSFTEETLFNLAFGSSSNTHSLNTDIAGAGGFSDPIDFSGNTPVDGVVYFVTDLTGTTTTTSAYASDYIYVMVSDADRNDYPTSLETLEVTLTTSTGDSLEVTLTETGIDTGVFTGQAPSAYNATANTADLMLQVISGSTVDASYTEYTAPAVTATRVAPQLTVQNPLTVAKTVSPATALPGSAVTYTVTITNHAQGAAAVTDIVDTLPASFSYVAGSTAGLTTNDPAISYPALTWSTSAYPILGYSTATLSFKASAAGARGSVHTNSIAVSGNNFAPLSITGVAPVTIIGPLVTITKEVDLTTALPGDTLTYTITIENIGTATAAFSIILDSAPAETEYLAGTMRAGGAAADYASAEPLTDAEDGYEALTLIPEPLTAKATAGQVEVVVENLAAGSVVKSFFQVVVK